MPLKTSKNNTAQLPMTAADLMPKNKEATRILRERAIYLARHERDNKKEEGLVSYIRFRLGAKECYGIPYLYIKEVIQHLTPTKVPFAPYYVAGIINRRGALLPVFDLKLFFHIQPSPVEHTHIILISSGNTTVGILADDIDGSDTYDPALLDASLTSADLINPDYIMGLHQGVTAIINVAAILADPQK